MGKPLYVADLFCGAGGSSSGLLAAAAKKGFDTRLYAFNHWEVAINTHQTNHPLHAHTTFCSDLASVLPDEVVKHRQLDLLWASPSCTHHSRARGGRPRSNQLRAQPDYIFPWLNMLYVKRVIVENVPEFVEWGPLDRKGNPIASRKGDLFKAWLNTLSAAGYRYEWRILCCADYGDVTTRSRFFLQAVLGRGKIRWPKPTHARDGAGGLEPWVAARTIIDWSNPGRSIFNRSKPLAPNTLKRIEAGISKFWGEWAKPFLIVLRSGGNKNTARSLDLPLPTATAGGGHFGLVTAEPFLSAQNNWPSQLAGRTLDLPLPTQTTANHFGLVEPAFVVPQLSTGRPRSIDEPLPTITATGTGNGLVRPFLTKYYGTGSSADIDEPLDSVTTKPRFGLVTADGVELDILYRMLQPNELAAAHSFDKDYVFHGTKADQTTQIGNSVPVKTSEAIGECAMTA